MTASDSSRFRAGGVSGIIAALTTAVVLFAVFRMSVSFVSVAVIGCWALIQGFFLVSRIADSGASSNVTRYVSVQLKAAQSVSVWKVFVASAVISTVPVVAISAALGWPVIAYVTHQYGSTVNPLDIKLLGFAAFTFGVLSSVSTIMLAICEGAGRLVAKNYAITFSNVIGLVVAVPALIIWGAPGIGATYVAMAASQLLIASGMLLQLRRALPAPARTKISVLMALFWRENLQLSAVALIRLSFEPTTKFLLSLAAPLGAIAAFELALRVATQVRVLGQASVQPLLAFGARHGTSMSPEVSNKFRQVNKTVAFLSGRATEIQLVAAPIVSLAGLATIDPDFLAFFALLSVANGLNLAGVVGYNYQLSSGSLRPLLHIQAVMALINVALGLASLAWLGSLGVVSAYAIAFAYGGIASLQLLLAGLGGSARSHFIDHWGLALLFRVALWCSLLAAARLTQVENDIFVLIPSFGLAVVLSLLLLRWLKRNFGLVR